ncbi:MAG: hypothetical protein ACP5QK_13305, partial [Myxococcota bacterium]
GGQDIWILKLRGDGNIEWQKTYGGSSSDYVFSVQQTKDEGYIVGAVTESFSLCGYNIWVLKLRANGDIEWERTYGGGKLLYASNIQETRDGGYVVAGTTYSFDPYNNIVMWILKLKPDGTIDGNCGNIIKTTKAVVKDTKVFPSGAALMPKSLSIDVVQDISVNSLDLDFIIREQCLKN